MSLCEVCRSIDFLNIPRLPATCEGYSTHNKSSALLSIYKKRTSVSDANENHHQADEPLGQPFHQSLEGLTVAAADCAVCEVVKRDVEQLQTESAEEAETFRRQKIHGPDWKMSLARSVNDISGFMVVSADAERESVVWVLSTVGLCVDDDGTLSNVVIGRQIDADASSEKTFHRASKWVQQCDADHTSTRCSVPDAALPSRVLDVKSTASSELNLYESHGETGKYAALSHPWETDTTAKHDIDLYKDSVDLEKLPKTFQDAVTMTRKLGLRYLWIDALCIPQDDLPTWDRASSQTASIYANAYITLSATGSPNDTAGMLTTRSIPTYTHFPYTHNNVQGTIHVSSLPKEVAACYGNASLLRDEPLSQSGWALQERYLSPRVLHFGSSQLFFECYGHFLSEDGFRMQGRIDTLYADTQPEWFKTKSANASRGTILWQNIVSLYCRRTLPKSSDKLPALSNLAASIAEQTNDTYLAGLWRSNLTEGLIWQAVGVASRKTSEVKEYRAPSWSWASIDGPFGMFCMGTGPDAGEWSDVAEVLDCNITLKGENPFGEVKDGWLKLRAPLEPLFARGDDPKKQVWKLKTKNGEEGGTYCIFDTVARIEASRGVQLYALLLTKHASRRSEDWNYHGIVVAPVEGQEGRYKRMGKVVFDNETLGDCEWMEDEGKLADVMLV